MPIIIFNAANRSSEHTSIATTGIDVMKDNLFAIRITIYKKQQHVLYIDINHILNGILLFYFKEPVCF